MAEIFRCDDPSRLTHALSELDHHPPKNWVQVVHPFVQVKSGDVIWLLGILFNDVADLPVYSFIKV